MKVEATITAPSSIDELIAHGRQLEELGYDTIMLVGAIFYVVADSQLLTQGKTDGKCLWLEGAGEEFLRTIPEYQYPKVSYGEHLKHVK